MRRVIQTGCGIAAMAGLAAIGIVQEGNILLTALGVCLGGAGGFWLTAPAVALAHDRADEPGKTDDKSEPKPRRATGTGRRRKHRRRLPEAA